MLVHHADAYAGGTSDPTKRLCAPLFVPKQGRDGECRVTFKVWPVLLERLQGVVKECFAAYRLELDGGGAEAS